MKFKVGDFVKANSKGTNLVQETLGSKIHRVTYVDGNAVEVETIPFSLFARELKKVNYLQTKLGKILYK